MEPSSPMQQASGLRREQAARQPFTALLLSHRGSPRFTPDLLIVRSSGSRRTGRPYGADVASGSKSQPVSSTRLIAFDLSGTPILEGPNEPFGDVPLVGSKDGLWSIGSGTLCSAPQMLWRVDPATGGSTDITALRTPIEPCLTENPTSSQITVANRSVFILEATGTTRPSAVLYRVQREMTGRGKSD